MMSVVHRGQPWPIRSVIDRLAELPRSLRDTGPARPMRRMLLLALLLVATAGCDPGYSYHPVDRNGRRLGEWSVSMQGVHFFVEPYHTLVGTEVTVASLRV